MCPDVKWYFCQNCQQQLLLFSCYLIWLFVTSWTATYQASLSFTVSQSLLRFMSIELVMPSNHLVLCQSLLLLPSLFPASGSFPISLLFPSGGQNFGGSASASVLSMSIQSWFPLDGLVWSACSPKDSQESSPTPQLEGINSSVLSLPYGSTLTSVTSDVNKMLDMNVRSITKVIRTSQDVSSTH